ncbi:MAG: hypothetical protein IJ762_02245 [Bacteroidaceae bacterium]|nr:hypothetical protein [Bacteroidaceae bacterium]
MRKWNLWLLASLFIAAFTLSACGDDDEETKDGPVKTSTTTVEDLVGTWNIGNSEENYIATFTRDQVTFKRDGEVEFQGSYLVKDGVVSFTWDGTEYKSVQNLLYDKSVLVLKQVFKNGDDETEMLGMMLFKQGKKVNVTSNDIQGFWCWYEEFGDETIIRTAIKIEGDRFELIITPWGERYVGTYTYSGGLLYLNVSAAYTSREEHTGYGELWGRMNPQTLECDDWRTLDEENWHVDAVSGGPFIANGNEAYGIVANLRAIFQKKK